MSDPVRIGTRRSQLAMAQTGAVIAGLRSRHRAVRFETVPMSTSGDRTAAPGSPRDFTDSLDRALLAGEVDLAVHSAKDLPVSLPNGLRLVACPPRADPRDALIVRPGISARRLPKRARVGSSSPRRRAQLLRWRPDLRVVDVQGNVDTRLASLSTREVDAMVLAVAGLVRLGRDREISRVLPVTFFLPAPGQGALAILARAEDDGRAELAGAVDDPPTRSAVIAERAFAAALGGDCRHPVAAWAEVSATRLSMVGEVLAPNGSGRLRTRRGGPSAAAERVGEAAADALIRRGADVLLGRPG